jgi:hypothetical protein
MVSIFILSIICHIYHACSCIYMYLWFDWKTYVVSIVCILHTYYNVYLIIFVNHY